jgi:hypothetical protein
MKQTKQDPTLLLEHLYTESANVLKQARQLRSAEIISLKTGGNLIHAIDLRRQDDMHYEDARTLVVCMIHDLEAKFESLSDEIGRLQLEMSSGGMIHFEELEL